MDLPGWQALAQELEPHGITIITVCMDIEGAEGARPWIERANPSHPSLIDATHALGERFGVVNIPNALWIDETGTVVRPAEPAWPGPRDDAPGPLAGDDLPERILQMREQAGQIRADRDAYRIALRDWAANGAASKYVLSAEEVVRRSQPRDSERARAAAHFALGRHLHGLGRVEAAQRHFREAHRGQPENWTYKRQAWELASRVGGDLDRFWQGPRPGHEEEWPYEGDWVRDITALGAAEYYPEFRI